MNATRRVSKRAAFVVSTTAVAVCGFILMFGVTSGAFSSAAEGQGDSVESPQTTSPQPCLALAGVKPDADNTIGVVDVAQQQIIRMDVNVFCAEAEALRPPASANLLMENYVASGQVQATYYRKTKVAQDLGDGNQIILSSHDPTPLSESEAQAIIEHASGR